MRQFLLSLFGLLLLTACASPAPAASAPTTAPVEEAALASPDAVIASADVEPAQIVELGFTISALVKEIPVREGDVVEAGQKLFRAGDMQRGIPACIACHGPRGVGHSLAGFPKISFQHAAYIKTQLEAFRAGTRANDLNGMMRDTAHKLTDKDIEVLSKYLGGLH